MNPAEFALRIRDVPQSDLVRVEAIIDGEPGPRVVYLSRTRPANEVWDLGTVDITVTVQATRVECVLRLKPPPKVGLAAA